MTGFSNQAESTAPLAAKGAAPPWDGTYDTVLICADSSSKLCVESGVDVQVVLLLLPMLLLSALPVRAQIAVSANDTTEILVDGVRVLVPDAPPDTVTLIDMSARPPKIIA